VRFGWLGRFMGRVFLYPGWPSSAPFIMLAAALFSFLLYARAAHAGDWSNFTELATFCLLLPPAILFPQVLGWLLLRGTRSGPGARYFVAVTICIIAWIICQSFNVAFYKSWIPALAAILPPAGWALLSTGSIDPSAEPLAWVLVAISSSLTMIVVCTRALRHWATFTVLEQQAGGLVKVRKPSRKRLPNEPGQVAPPPSKGPSWN
jgi:hypothetical protein